MKKIILIGIILPFISLIALSFYLYFSYIYFYDFIGKSNLKSHIIDNPIVFVNYDSEPKTVTYMSLGDSLSAGVGAPTQDKRFTYIFAKKLSEKYGKVNFYDVSWPGDTTREVIKNQLPQVIRENPQYITLLIGTNDIHGRIDENSFKENYRLIISTLIEKTNAQIIVMNIPYLGSSKIVRFPYNLLLDSKIKQYNAIIGEIIMSESKENRLKYIDLYNETYEESKINKDYYSTDQFHPSENGYMFWANILNAD